MFCNLPAHVQTPRNSCSEVAQLLDISGPILLNLYMYVTHTKARMHILFARGKVIDRETFLKRFGGGWRGSLAQFIQVVAVKTL